MVNFSHRSVMPREVIALMEPHEGGVYVDGTVGGAGHSGLILSASSPDGRLIGFDRDAEAVAAATERLKEFGDRFVLINENFDRIEEFAPKYAPQGIDGFILDLGVSSHQLDTAERGFSFQQDAPLDMRMDRAGDTTAEMLVNELSSQELERIIRDYGEERFARRIAGAIERERSIVPIRTTLQLAELVRRAIPAAKREDRIHPATRTFQALRIAVNDELGSLERGLQGALRLLKPGGRGLVISFHSLEDRIVKNMFREWATGCICPRWIPVCGCGRKPVVKLLSRQSVKAGPEEIAANPRSRSARMRGVQKLTGEQV